jgi:Fe2+ transport system protein B
LSFRFLRLDDDPNLFTKIDWPSFVFKLPNQFPLQKLLHTNKSRIYCSVLTLAVIQIEIKKLHLETLSTIYYDHSKALKEESEFLSSFDHLRLNYEKFLVLFLTDLSFTRKQRAIELDLNLRKKRLIDLRDLRLKKLQESKIEQLRKEEEERLDKEEAEKNKQSTLMKAAKQTKQMIRGMNDKIREMRYAQQTAMSEDELKIAERIKEKSKDGLGKIFLSLPCELFLSFFLVFSLFLPFSVFLAFPFSFNLS